MASASANFASASSSARLSCACSLTLMPALQPPRTYDELLERMRHFTGHGLSTLESLIRDFNAWRQTEAERSKLRAEDRTTFVATRARELAEEAEAAKRAAYRQQAEKEFDTTRPPIEVPPQVDMSLARKVLAESKK
jgi:hypothetical protein